jgi:hypothetical protein
MGYSPFTTIFQTFLEQYKTTSTAALAVAQAKL